MQNKFICRGVQFFAKFFFYLVPFKDPEIIQGEGSFLTLPEIIKNDKFKKPLIVTDEGLFRLGLLNPLLNKLSENEMEYALYNKVIPNPTCENVMDGYNTYISSGCDCIIAVGGGSPMDTAKTIGAKVARPTKDIRKFLGLFPVKKAIPMLYAVPTTAGTGSEATIAAVITDEKNNHKVPLIDPALMPKKAILDSLLTKGLPPFVTATTGMDALCHAIEAYANHTYCTKHEMELCKKAIKLIFDNILVAYNNGDDLEARSNMQLAALYAGRAFTRGSVGYVHAIGHTFGGLYHISHGEAMAVILPKVLRKYGKSAEKRLAEIADFVGLNGNDKHEKAIALISWIEKTNKQMNVKDKFDIIEDSDFNKIIDWALKESNPLYPCPQVWKRKDFEEMLRIIKGE